MPDRLRVWKNSNALQWETATSVSAGLLWDNVAFVDITNGDDSTGAVGNAALPYATASAAESAVSSGQTVWFRAGTHTAANLGKDGITYHIEAGAELNDNGSSGIFYSASSITMNIINEGLIKSNGVRLFELFDSTVHFFSSGRIESTNGSFCIFPKGNHKFYGYFNYVKCTGNARMFTNGGGSSGGGEMYVKFNHIDGQSRLFDGGGSGGSGNMFAEGNYMTTTITSNEDAAIRAYNGEKIRVKCQKAIIDTNATSNTGLIYCDAFSGNPGSVWFEGEVSYTGTGSSPVNIKEGSGAEVHIESSNIIYEDNSANRAIIQHAGSGNKVYLRGVELQNLNTNSGSHGISTNVTSSAGVSNLDMQNVVIKLHSTAVGTGAKAINGSGLNYRALTDVFSNGAWDGTNLVSATTAWVDSEVKSD